MYIVSKISNNHIVYQKPFIAEEAARQEFLRQVECLKALYANDVMTISNREAVFEDNTDTETVFIRKHSLAI